MKRRVRLLSVQQRRRYLLDAAARVGQYDAQQWRWIERAVRRANRSLGRQQLADLEAMRQTAYRLRLRGDG